LFFLAHSGALGPETYCNLYGNSLEDTSEEVQGNLKVTYIQLPQNQILTGDIE